MILSTIEPGGGTGDEAYTHDSDEEVVIVLEGRLELWVGDEHHLLEAGDAITYSSRLPHRNRNTGPRRGGRPVLLDAAELLSRVATGRRRADRPTPRPTRMTGACTS